MSVNCGRVGLLDAGSSIRNQSGIIRSFPKRSTTLAKSFPTGVTRVCEFDGHVVRGRRGRCVSDLCMTCARGDRKKKTPSRTAQTNVVVCRTTLAHGEFRVGLVVRPRRLYIFIYFYCGRNRLLKLNNNNKRRFTYAKIFSSVKHVRRAPLRPGPYERH